MGWQDNISDAMNMSLNKVQEMVRDRKAWRAAIHGVGKTRTQLGDWTTAIPIQSIGPAWTWQGDLSELVSFYLQQSLYGFDVKRTDLMDFPGGTVVKNLPANVGHMGSAPGPGRFHMPQSN